MKTKILTIATAAFAITASAQNLSYKGSITVIPKALEQKGDSLYVNLDLVMNDVKMHNYRGAGFTPVLVSSNQKMELPKISVKGNNNYTSYKRSVFLANKSRKTSVQVAENDVYRLERNDNRTLSYSRVILFEDWMKDARLDIKKDDSGCGNVNTIAVQRLANVSLEQIIVIAPYVVTPYLAYVQPTVEVEKQRALEREAHLDFAVGKSDIRPDFGNNANELGNIESMIKEVENDDAVTIRQITISGYASPEGPLSLNKNLSETRARAMERYLESRCDVPKDKYGVLFGGEDWVGLIKLVNQSDMAYKTEVLDVLNRVELKDGSESHLKTIGAGEPYKYIYTELFPKLRRVVCKVDYNVRQFNLEEAKQVFETHPQHLSLDEMFRIANTYEKGSDKFNEIFETAARMFPQDETANLNAALTALARRDTVSAEKYLSKIKSRVRVPEYDNAMGLLAMLKGDYDKAEQIFKQVEQAGISAATENLKELNTKRQNELQIKQQSK